jgi:hypothetical protein
VATEEYAIGYEEGNQVGWNAAMDSLPAQRPWVGLTQEEVEDSYNSDYKAQTRAIEAKLKEKNT